jgi:hypothetical protein
MARKAPRMLGTMANRRHQQLVSQEILMHRLAATPCEVKTLEHRTTRYQASSLPRAQQAAGPWCLIEIETVVLKVHGNLDQLGTKRINRSSRQVTAITNKAHVSWCQGFMEDKAACTP